MNSFFMFFHVFVLFCLVQQWTLFSFGQDTDDRSPPSVSILDKSIKSNNHVRDDQSCKKNDSCSCFRSDGTSIDLHFLNTAPKARFTVKVADQILQWNPCSGIGGEDVAVQYGDPQSTMPYGRQQSATFSTLHNNTDVIDYTQDFMYSSRILLLCNKKINPTLMFISQDNYEVVGAYQGPCDPKTDDGTDGSLSIGSIISISFFVILIVYIVVGILINVFVRKFDGRNRFPNYGFWSGLPSLIKDGCKFTFCYMRRRKSGYGEI